MIYGRDKKDRGQLWKIIFLLEFLIKKEKAAKVLEVYEIAQGVM